MRKLITLLTAMLMVGCYPTTTSANEGNNTPTQMKEMVARVTYYWPGDGGQIARQTSTGNLARGNKTAAVDPRVIPYGTKIHIPKMQKVFVAHDTGSAVKSRKASKILGRDNIVIDIFCESRAEAQRKIKTYPMFMKIRIESE